MLERQQAIEILTARSQGAQWTKHCFAVADSAVRIGVALKEHRAVDGGFLWSAALLHDIGRHVSHDPVLHGVEGYKLLTALGHEKEARICASHILFGLRADEAVQFGLPACDFMPCTIEEQLVTLVDFLIEFDQPTTLERRFASLRRRNAGNPFFLERLDRAHASARSFMARIEQEIGESIERLVALQDQPS
jgi:HD superfamily phosphodiesterase